MSARATIFVDGVEITSIDASLKYGVSTRTIRKKVQAQGRRFTSAQMLAMGAIASKYNPELRDEERGISREKAIKLSLIPSPTKWELALYA
jgi:hypothetical protein